MSAPAVDAALWLAAAPSAGHRSSGLGFLLGLLLLVAIGLVAWWASHRSERRRARRARRNPPAE